MAATHCPNRDSCPCHGPTPLCYHGHYGPRHGRPETRKAADGADMVVRLVTPDACLRCEAERAGERETPRS